MKRLTYPNYSFPKVRILLKKIKIYLDRNLKIWKVTAAKQKTQETQWLPPSTAISDLSFPTVAAIKEEKEFPLFLSVVLASGTGCVSPTFHVGCGTALCFGRWFVWWRWHWGKSVFTAETDRRSCPCEPGGSCMDPVRAKPMAGWCLPRLALHSHMNGPPKMSLPHYVFDNSFSLIVIGYLFWAGPFYSDICPTKVVNKEFTTDENRLLTSRVECCLKMYLQQSNICASLQVKVKGHGFLTKFITTIYIVLWFYVFFRSWKWARVSCWPPVAPLREQPIPIC